MCGRTGIPWGRLRRAPHQLPTEEDLACLPVILEPDEVPIGWPADQGTSLLQAIVFKSNIGLQLGDRSEHNTNGLFDDQQIEVLEAKMAVAAKIVQVGIKNTNDEDVTLHIVCTSIEDGQLMFACSRTCQQASQALSSSPHAAPRGASASPTVETQDSRSEQGLGGTGDLDDLLVRDSITATMVEQDCMKRVAQSSLTRGVIREKVVSYLTVIDSPLPLHEQSLLLQGMLTTEQDPDILRVFRSAN